MEDKGSKALKRPCEDLVQAASDMTAAASSGRKAIKPHYEDRFEVLNRKSATAASSSGGRRDARLEVPSECIWKYPPELLEKIRNAPKRGRRVPRPKVCDGPAKPFVLPPEVRGKSFGNDFFRELIMADPSYKAAVAAGYKVEITGRLWTTEIPGGGNREEGYRQHWVGDRLVPKFVRRAAPTKVCGGLASDTATAAASGRKDLKHPFEDHVEDPNSTAVIAASSISGGKAVKRPLVNSASEMEDEGRKPLKLPRKDLGPSFLETASDMTAASGGKDVKHPCEDPNSTSATAASEEKFMGGQAPSPPRGNLVDNPPNPACEQQTTPPY